MQGCGQGAVGDIVVDGHRLKVAGIGQVGGGLQLCQRGRAVWHGVGGGSVGHAVAKTAVGGDRRVRGHRYAKPGGQRVQQVVIRPDPAAAIVDRPARQVPIARQGAATGAGPRLDDGAVVAVVTQPQGCSGAGHAATVDRCGDHWGNLARVWCAVDVDICERNTSLKFGFQPGDE